LKVNNRDISHSLKSSGLVLDIGLFKFNICSSLRSIEETLSILYCDYAFTEYDSINELVDFQVQVKKVKHFSSVPYINSQAQFFLDSIAPFTPLPIQHAPAIIEWGMNWCISSQVNTHLVVHAAVIEKNGFAAVMPAPPGSGKSTLTASLVQEGWRLLSDELTLIQLDTYRVSPFPRPVSLKNESINVIKNRYPDVVFGPVSSDTAKGTVCHIRPPSLSVKNQHIDCPVGWIIFPKYQAGVETEFLPFDKAQTLMSIAENSFNYSVLGQLGFDAIKNTVATADCYQFKYSSLDEAVSIFSKLEPPK